MISHTDVATQQDSRQRVDKGIMAYDQKLARDTTKDVERWAAQTMMAQSPPASSSSPVEEPSRSVSSSLPSALPTRCDSAAASSWSAKSSAPPDFPSSSGGDAASSSSSRTFVPLSYPFASVRERPTPGRTSHRTFIQGLASERPSSMIVTSTSSSLLAADSLTNIYLAEQKIESTTQPHLKSCLKSAASILTSGLDSSSEQASPASPYGGMLAGKSVHISEHLPRHRQQSSDSPTFDGNALASPLRMRSSSGAGSRARRRANSHTLSNELDYQSQTHSSHPSPSFTSSTCGSEEDVPALMTPMDEQGPRYESMGRVESIIGQDKEQDEHKTQLKILTDVRRANQQTSKSTAATDADIDTSPDSEEVASAAPVISHSTLLNIGNVKGTTPPKLQTPTDASPRQTSISDSVVSVGLEMGLGVNIMTSTMSTVQTASHMSRPGAPSYIDMNDVASALGQVDEKLPSSPLSHPTHHSEQIGSDLNRDAVEHEEAELSRRRTTGGLRKDAPMRPIGRRRAQRGMGAQGERPVGRPRQTSESHTAMYRDAHDDYPNSFATSPIVENLAMHPATSPLNTPSHSTKGLSSPMQLRASMNDGFVSGSHDFTTSYVEHGASNKTGLGGAYLEPQTASAANLDGGFMGIGQCGHFGPGVRSKVAQVMQHTCDLIPLAGHEGEIVSLVEYGSANSRSGLLFRPLVSALAKRAHDKFLQAQVKPGKIEPDYFGNVRIGDDDPEATSNASFCITHEDSAVSDLRPLMTMMESHPDSYLSKQWQAEHYPRLTDAIFSTFSMRPFAARIAPPNSVSAGTSLMDLHWLHMPREGQQQMTRSAKAHAELSGFLKARAHEFKKDGVLYMAYIARSHDIVNPDSFLSIGSSPTPSMRAAFSGEGKTHSRSSSLGANRDLWLTLGNILAPCIQRLVSCGMLKSEVARHLLDLPLYPRTASQTKSALQSVKQYWEVDWSCGLGESGPAARTVGTRNELQNEPQPLRLAHPAWTTYKSGCLASNPFSEHMTQLFKNLYEAHFRSVLRDKGAMSKGAVEFILDSLWDALFSRIADKEPHPISNVAIEVCVYALRRR